MLPKKLTISCLVVGLTSAFLFAITRATTAPRIKIAITVVFIVVIINYYILNITSTHQEAKHSTGKVTGRY
jgi:hypothetical protein